MGRLDAHAASVPEHYVLHLREEVARRTLHGATLEGAAGQIGAESGCRSNGVDLYARNWPAIDAQGSAFLCAVHSGEPPAGYVEMVQRALLARVNLGMSLSAAADDLRAQGGCGSGSTAAAGR